MKFFSIKCSGITIQLGSGLRWFTSPSGLDGGCVFMLTYSSLKMYSIWNIKKKSVQVLGGHVLLAIHNSPTRLSHTHKRHLNGTCCRENCKHTRMNITIPFGYLMTGLHHCSESTESCLYSSSWHALFWKWVCWLTFVCASVQFTLWAHGCTCYSSYYKHCVG